MSTEEGMRAAGAGDVPPVAPPHGYGAEATVRASSPCLMAEMPKCPLAVRGARATCARSATALPSRCEPMRILPPRRFCADEPVSACKESSRAHSEDRHAFCQQVFAECVELAEVRPHEIVDLCVE